MKKTLPLLLLTITFTAFSQDSEISDKQQIKSVINQFFDSLEKKDSLLMQKTAMNDAQIWRRVNVKDSIKVDVSYSKDFWPKLHSYPDVKEIALNFQISVHNGIAIAWVPYEFWVKCEFSHCGIDVFTLFEMDGTWKIMSLAYTIEKKDCNGLKQ